MVAIITLSIIILFEFFLFRSHTTSRIFPCRICWFPRRWLPKLWLCLEKTFHYHLCWALVQCGSYSVQWPQSMLMTNLTVQVVLSRSGSGSWELLVLSFLYRTSIIPPNGDCGQRRILSLAFAKRTFRVCSSISHAYILAQPHECAGKAVLRDQLIYEIDRKAIVKNVALVLAQFVVTVTIGLSLSLQPWSALGAGAVGAIFGVALIFAPPIHRESINEDRLYQRFSQRLIDDITRHTGGRWRLSNMVQRNVKLRSRIADMSSLAFAE